MWVYLIHYLFYQEFSFIPELVALYLADRSWVYILYERVAHWLSPALPGISWAGTCVKLKPFPMQASLTSLQFRALKSALAAKDSMEKVQMMVSSLSIVHLFEDPYC